MSSNTSSAVISSYLDKGYIKTRRRPNYHNHEEKLSFLKRKDMTRYGKTKTKEIEINRLSKQHPIFSKKCIRELRKERMDEIYYPHEVYDFLDQTHGSKKEWYYARKLETEYLLSENKYY